MKAVERYETILKALQEEEVVMVGEIHELTGASMPTIRRDLADMEAKNLVVRFHGGVKLAEQNERGLHFSLENRKAASADAKDRIAAKAASLVEDGDIIFIDAGTTTLNMCRYLEGRNITVITNGLQQILELNRIGIPTFVLDGMIKRESDTILSQDTVDRIGTLTIDKAFLGTRGVDVNLGFTTSDSFDSVLKRKALETAAQTYVLADATKLFRKKFYTFGKLGEAVLITDQAQGIEKLGPDVLLA